MLHPYKIQTTFTQHLTLLEATCTPHPITPTWPLHMQLLQHCRTTFIPLHMGRHNISTPKSPVHLPTAILQSPTKTILLLIASSEFKFTYNFLMCMSLLPENNGTWGFSNLSLSYKYTFLKLILLKLRLGAFVSFSYFYPGMDLFVSGPHEISCVPSIF